MSENWRDTSINCWLPNVSWCLLRRLCTYCICMYCRYWLCFLLMCLFHVESPRASVVSDPVPVLEGENVTLICNTTGTPPLFIEWTKVNDPTVLSSTSLLTLYSVSRPGTPSETVEYRCTAKNGYGDPASAVLTVQVFCKYIFHFILIWWKLNALYDRLIWLNYYSAQA